DQTDGELEFLLVCFFMFDLRNAVDLSELVWMAQFVKDESAVLGADHNNFLAIAQNDLANAYFATGLERLTQKRIRFRGHGSIRAGEIGGVVEGGRDFVGVNES